MRDAVTSVVSKNGISSTSSGTFGLAASFAGIRFPVASVVIGVKLILHWLHVDISPAVPEISTPVSLGVIMVVLAVVTVASLVKTRNDPTAKAHPCSLKASRPQPADAERS